MKPCVLGEGEGYYDGTGIKNFGNMYYGLIYPDQAFDELTRGMLTSAFWNAEMVDGIISYPMPNEIPAEKRKAIRPMQMKPFGNNL